MAHNFCVMLSARGAVEPQAWGGECSWLHVGAGLVKSQCRWAHEGAQSSPLFVSLVTSLDVTSSGLIVRVTDATVLGVLHTLWA